MTANSHPTATATDTAPALLLMRLIVAGALATFAWDVTTDVLTRLVLAQSPQPFGLVQALLGIEQRWLAEAIHYAVGMIAFPLGYVVAVRRLSPLPWVLNGALWGIALWIAALGVMAPLAGFGFMLGFGDITWASGIGHVVVGLVIAWSWERGVQPTRVTG